SKRCANFSELLKQHQSNFRLLQCARIDMKTIEVLLHADATGLLKEASLQSRWTLAFYLK
ncbi:MAG: hypothetical protein EBX62_10265, partial [Betaproteobacteria bacterium]|nr:hypothetical protein [Betaproteobacteria bacterium]